MDFSRLKRILQCKLDFTIVDCCACNPAEGGVTQRSIRAGELGSVEEIESLAAELNTVRLLNPELFEQREIPGLLSRRVDKSRACVAISQRANEYSGSGAAVALGANKRGRIEPLIQRARVPDTPHNRAWSYIRTRRTGAAGIHRITRLTYAYGEPRSELENAVKGPAAQHRPLQSFARPEDRQFPNVVVDETKALIQTEPAAVKCDVARVLRHIACIRGRLVHEIGRA